MAVAFLAPVVKADWICMDCIADPCVNREHAWVEATRMITPEGSEGWLVMHPENNEATEPE